MHIRCRSFRTAAAAVVVALAFQGCSRDEPAPAAPAPPAAEAFHASKPLRIEVSSAAGEAASANVEWLGLELRFLLSQGRMRIAASDAPNQFALRVQLSADNKEAVLALVAPDGSNERQMRVDIAATNRLDIVRALAARLPGFVGAAHAAKDWTALIGTQNVDAYDSYARSETELLGTAARGYTKPVASPQVTRTIERLEALTKRDPQFARAWALLSVGYLSLGGQDGTALVSLAETSAERAIALDDGLAVAYAADGLVRLRRGSWGAAQQQFERALKIDANVVPALEGFACLLVDAGQPTAALSIAARALAAQPNNVGASECDAYAKAGTSKGMPEDETAQPPAARLRAVTALLANDADAAQKALRVAGDSNTWAGPVLRASRSRRSIREALQALTAAASEGRIDMTTEIQFGAALRQPDFVFNRMERLNRQGAPAPLRVLWLPQADFLRKQERFEQLVNEAGLPAFWQQYGPPEVCKSEPTTFACKP